MNTTAEPKVSCTFDLRIHLVEEDDDLKNENQSPFLDVTPQNYVTPGTVVTREPGFMR